MTEYAKEFPHRVVLVDASTGADYTSLGGGGTVAIDQTTPGTTDSVTVKASAGIGSLTETAPSTDTASSGLNGRLQRIAQRITSLLAFFATPTRSVSTAYEASRLASAAPATFLSVSGYNSKIVPQFIQIHNASSAPADTAVPIEVFLVPASSSFSFEALGLAGDAYSTGIYVCNSSTGPTKTIGSADCWFHVRYR